MDSESPIGLGFDKARFGEDAGAGARTGELGCTFCQRSILGSYYEVNGKTACELCRGEAERVRALGFTPAKGLRALVGGGAGGAVGALLYYGVARLTGYELGLIAIVVGLLVGFGVRWGSGGVGGRTYQILAVAITYVAIVSTYVPFIIDAIREQAKMEQTGGETAGGEPVSTVEQRAATGSEEPPSLGTFALALGAFALFILASPFLAGIQNAIGILIIGIALYEAWKVNRRVPLAIEGPFQVGSGTLAVSPR